MHLETKLIHQDSRPTENGPVCPPISVSTTFLRPTRRDLAGSQAVAATTSSTLASTPTGTTTTPTAIDEPFVYSRDGQPNVVRVEVLLGVLEGGHAVAYASGVSAILAALLHWLPKRIAVDGGYHGTHAVMAAYQAMRASGVEVSFHRSVVLTTMIFIMLMMVIMMTMMLVLPFDTTYLPDL